MTLTVREAAKLLCTTERAVYRWISQRGIPVHKVQDRYRFNRAELLEWATQHGVRVSVSHFSGSERGNRMPRFAEALARGGVHEHVEGVDRDAVLRAVVELMPVADEDRDLLVDVLVAREALGSTGVGDGIAIPHVRSAIVLRVTEPSITLCYLARPVEFGAIDGKPVHTTFSIVTPTIRSHLYLLSRLAAALHDTGFRDAVRSKAPASKILEEARRLEATFSVPPPSAHGVR
jgi:PTS system nitrogen regulatory IIA component